MTATSVRGAASGGGEGGVKGLGSLVGTGQARCLRSKKRATAPSAPGKRKGRPGGLLLEPGGVRQSGGGFEAQRLALTAPKHEASAAKPKSIIAQAAGPAVQRADIVEAVFICRRSTDCLQSR